ncbi:polyphenol oxidase B, chloroplastic [Capsicum chacoense]
MKPCRANAPHPSKMGSTNTLPLPTYKCLSSSSSSFTNSYFIAKPSQIFLQRRRRCQSFKVSCNSNNSTGEHDKNLEANLDRRNLLLGLGGLYGVANLAPLAASATPIRAPDGYTCGTATTTCGDKSVTVPDNCCPPPIPLNYKAIPYYKFPTMTKLRIRSPAQNADKEYIDKYNKAISKMKELDKTEPFNPLGFKQQAHIHCAYCNGAYKIGDKVLQVHNSWLFFPFHRWYLYFYERILGTLIDDPTFALPYWNWDHPKGMRLPPMFDSEGSSLFDENRNQSHRNGTIIDLGYFGDEVQRNELQIMTNNLTLMYRQMVTNAPCPLLFFGSPYSLGNNIETPGTIENIPHIPVHIWTGTVAGTPLPNGNKTSCGEDMGNFYSAGLDPVFYCHHANVDRMWNIWKTIGGKRKDIIHPDWRNSEFFFYDENKKPYRVKIQDCLDSQKMGYDYAEMCTPWRDFKPKLKRATTGKANTSSVPNSSEVFPIAKLDKPISFSITRPATARTQDDKNEKEEMLTFNNIKYDNTKYIRFDVYLNMDKDNVMNSNNINVIEFAGSYTSLPHVHLHKAAARDEPAHQNTSVNFQLAITELLEDIGLENEESITVTLCPRKCGEITSIACADIQLADC